MVHLGIIVNAFFCSPCLDTSRTWAFGITFLLDAGVDISGLIFLYRSIEVERNLTRTFFRLLENTVDQYGLLAEVDGRLRERTDLQGKQASPTPKSSSTTRFFFWL